MTEQFAWSKKKDALVDIILHILHILNATKNAVHQGISHVARCGGMMNSAKETFDWKMVVMRNE